MAGIFASEKAKLSLAVVLIIGAGGLFIWQFVGSGAIADDVNFICVATGKTFSIDRDDIKSLPVENPKTGERTLLPCCSRDGVLYVDARYSRLLFDKLKEKNRYVDTESLAVQTAP